MDNIQELTSDNAEELILEVEEVFNAIKQGLMEGEYGEF